MSSLNVSSLIDILCPTRCKCGSTIDVMIGDEFACNSCSMRVLDDIAYGPSASDEVIQEIQQILQTVKLLDTNKIEKIDYLYTYAHEETKGGIHVFEMILHSGSKNLVKVELSPPAFSALVRENKEYEFIYGEPCSQEKVSNKYVVVIMPTHDELLSESSKPREQIAADMCQHVKWLIRQGAIPEYISPMHMVYRNNSLQITCMRFVRDTGESSMGTSYEIMRAHPTYMSVIKETPVHKDVKKTKPSSKKATKKKECEEDTLEGYFDEDPNSSKLGDRAYMRYIRRAAESTLWAYMLHHSKQVSKFVETAENIHGRNPDKSIIATLSDMKHSYLVSKKYMDLVYSRGNYPDWNIVLDIMLERA